MAQITVNGKSFQGSKLKVQVFVDGTAAWVSDEKNIEINVIGDLKELESGSGNVNIQGSVHGDLKSGSGNITIKGDITGGITSGSANIKCGKVGGSVKTGSGNVIIN